MMRCHEWGVLDGRDQHFDCRSDEPKRIRRQWEREEKELLRRLRQADNRRAHGR